MPGELKKLLLVDDETGFLDVMSRRLRRRGIEVVVASSAGQALEVQNPASFDAAVTDLKMPGMDGLALLSHLRKKAPDLAVFMLTGHGGEAEALEAVEKGAAGYLHKPCELEELIAHIETTLAQRRRH